MDEALADSVFLDVTGRTAKRLLELADGQDEFILPVTQEELAGMVGASRERVNKAIASFRAKRFSTGGAFGVFKGTCSIIGRCTKAIARDISDWLKHPVDGAELGD